MEKKHMCMFNYWIAPKWLYTLALNYSCRQNYQSNTPHVECGRYRPIDSATNKEYSNDS